MKKERFILSLFLLGLFMFASCSQDEVFTEEKNDNAGLTRAASDTLTAEVIDYIYGWHYADLYVDAPGNLYGVYSKAYLFMIDLSNEVYGNIYWSLQELPNLSIGDKPTYGFCRDINENTYYITSTNQLVKVDRADQIFHLTDKFPENTVFLGITSAQINGNVFVSTAQGDGSDNPWQSYNTQTIYLISGNGTVTKIAENIQAPLVPKPPLVAHYWDGTDTFKMFTYTSVISKRQGTYVYGLDANGKYFMLNTSTGEVTYYTPKIPIQFLAAGTSHGRAIALSGRQIVELYPNAAKDVVIGNLPATIPENATILNFLMNADATIFYVVAYDESVEYGEPITYRLRLNN